LPTPLQASQRLYASGVKGCMTTLTILQMELLASEGIYKRVAANQQLSKSAFSS
jgi:hypothetical protein